MKTLLLVDDHEHSRSLLARRLMRRGYTVILAVDGGTCLQAAQAQRPDLILLDMNLPDMSGLETAAKLKALPDCKHIPIIGVSAHAGQEAAARAIHAGCQDYESKPIDFQQLLGKIATWTKSADIE